MKIIADENIPLVKEAFRHLGTVRTLPGRAITSQEVRNAEILLVRSVTVVDEELVAGSQLRFVGTATIGTDHVRTEALREHHIGFASAPGSNADSVAEYVFTAIMTLLERDGRNPADCSLAIIGVGNVGSRVARLAECAGITCLLNDPPKQRRMLSGLFKDLSECLSTADIVSLHVPLNREGDDATWHLADQAFFEKLQPGTIFINTSRGGVVDEAALIKKRADLGACVLDVWAGEPTVAEKTFACADIGTPHIAGYSFDGKVAGTRMLSDAVSAFFFRELRFDPQKFLFQDPPPPLSSKQAHGKISELLQVSCPLDRDHRQMQECVALPRDKRGLRFDTLRKEYPRRLQFSHYSIQPDGFSQPSREQLSRIGFHLVS